MAAVGACRPPQLKSTSLGFARSAHFALHTQAKQIFRTPIQEFAAEVFPEKDPSRAFITLRVDFVATRADGSAVRLHPRQAEGSTNSRKQLVGLAPRLGPRVQAGPPMPSRSCDVRQFLFLEVVVAASGWASLLATAAPSTWPRNSRATAGRGGLQQRHPRLRGGGRCAEGGAVVFGDARAQR